MATIQYTTKLGDTLHIYAVWRHAQHLHFKQCERFGPLFPENIELARHTQWRPHLLYRGVRHDVHAREALAETFGVDLALIKGPLFERPAHEGYIALCPHASRYDKEWHQGHWATLMRALDNHGLPYRWLPANGRGATLEFADVHQAVARAKVVIGVDSGPLHLADAYGVPVIGLYGPTHPACYGPYGSRDLMINHHPYPHDTSIWCKNGRPLMQSITVTEVLAKLDEALKL